MTLDTTGRPYPFGEITRLDTNPIYDTLRREEPISRVQLPYGGHGWLVTRYEDTKKVLSDPRFSTALAVGRDDIPRCLPEPPSPTMVTMDPPEHTRLRKLVVKAFTARRIEQLRPRIRQIINERLTEMEHTGQPADLVSLLALPLPVTVICEMLGVPPHDRFRFIEFSEAMMSTTARTRTEVAQAQSKFWVYLAELVAHRRAHPSDDLLTALITARDEEDRLTEQELISLVLILLVAGHETTANQIANFTYLLLAQRDRWTLLHDNPQLIPDAVEELLRWVQLSTGGFSPRIAKEDIDLCGTTIHAGEAVFTHTPSANRDETVFPHSTELDLTRDVNPHIAFGHGVHYCVGAQLARMELQESLSAMLQRFPSLHLAVPPDHVPWKTGLLVSGPQTLPLTW